MTAATTEKHTIYGFNVKTQKWVKRRTLIMPELLSLQMEALEEYENKYNMPHAYIPQGIDPNEDTTLGFMQRKTENNCKSYKTDYYHHDTFLFYKYQRQVIWMTRECGTCIFNASSYDSQDEKEGSLTSLKYYVNQERTGNIVYHINGDDIKRISGPEALGILDNCKVTAE